jgi:prepilin-type N-terminal cleavage/methylation domain-containing protein
MKKQYFAFTLIEMLTVIAIIAILAAILIPALSAGRERGNAAYCANNLSQIGKALMGYVNDNREKLPPVSRTPAGPESAWDLDILPYLNYQTNVFQCPSDPYRSGGNMRTYSANGGRNYDAIPGHNSPFGNYGMAPQGPLRFSDLDYNKSDIVLIGERPGDGVTRGNVGVFGFCGMDQIPGSVHQRGKGGNYLMGSMAVVYLETNVVVNNGTINYWTLHTE